MGWHWLQEILEQAERLVVCRRCYVRTPRADLSEHMAVACVELGVGD